MIADRSLKIGAVILAAGGSTRLGQSKQLLRVDGKTLLRRAAETIVRSGCSPIVIVTGADHERAATEIADLGLQTCHNPDWQRGMSTSIKVGLKCLLDLDPSIDAALISLCDQPFVDTAMINRLVLTFEESGKAMAAAAYDETVGVPAIFARAMFEKLFLLDGDKGARDLLRASGASIAIVEMNEAGTDIDTANDVDALQPGRS